MKYQIIIEETISECFEIEAESLEEAYDRAIEGYAKQELALEPGNLESAKVAVIDPDADDFDELVWQDIF